MHYPGRKLPFEIQIGDVGEPAPAYVSSISQGTIEIRGTSAADLSAADLAFSDRGSRLDLNEELTEKMIQLALAGVAFAYNHREYWSPVSLMCEWQEEGKFNHSFYEIRWHAPDHWLMTTIPAPVAGIRGWKPKAKP